MLKCANSRHIVRKLRLTIAFLDSITTFSLSSSGLMSQATRLRTTIAQRSDLLSTHAYVTNSYRRNVNFERGGARGAVKYFVKYSFNYPSEEGMHPVVQQERSFETSRNSAKYNIKNNNWLDLHTGDMDPVKVLWRSYKFPRTKLSASLKTFRSFS